MEPHYVLDLDDTLINTTQVFEEEKFDFTKINNLSLIKGAAEFLAQMGNRCVILSAGVKEIQFKKIEALYLRKLVRMVMVVESPEKKLQWLSTHVAVKKIDGEKVTVVGDRIDQEIQMGNRLDCVTVRMRVPGGKYFFNEPQIPMQKPDFTVSNFFELMQLPLRF